MTSLVLHIIPLLLLLISCSSLNVIKSNNNQLSCKSRGVSHVDKNFIMKSDTSDAEKESKLIPLYSLSKWSAVGLVGLEVPKLISKTNIEQSFLVISSYLAAAITASTLESASRRTRLSGTTFKTLNCGLTTAAKFSLVMSGVALWKYPVTNSLKTNYWLIILQSLLTISPCMRALKLGKRSLIKTPKISLLENSILGVAYLASAVHFFLQGVKNLLAPATFPVTLHSIGLFVIPASLLTLHDAANNDYSRLSSDTYKKLNLMVLIFSGIKALVAYNSFGFVANVNFVADVLSALFSLIGLILGLVLKK